MRISAIICAAGKGERAGLGKNKLLYPFHGANALYYTVKKLKAFAEHIKNSGDELAQIIVACAESDGEQVGAICEPLGCTITFGGDTRTESVYRALDKADGDYIIIHDGARPFTTIEQFSECLSCAKEYGSALLAMPVTDTIALQNDGWVADIPRRNSLYAIQTPQIFKAEEIRLAYEKAIKSGEQFTDDGSVYSRYISPARICAAGSAGNRKLTFKEDFTRTEEMELLGKTPDSGSRAGFGVDVHAFGGEAEFIKLCGVKVPCDRALLAHSDGDVALHAVMDALLSSAGLEDIGHYFPDSDPSLKGADSANLAKKVVEIIAEKGLKVLSLSIAIQAEKPRLAKYICEMKKKLGEITGADEEEISITAGTCEGLGFVGEKLGIAAYCAAVTGKI